MRAERGKAAATVVSAAATWLVALAGCESANTYAPPPPPEVTVSPPLRRTVMTYQEYTGTTRPFEVVDLRARVRGFLTKAEFKEGDDVKAGDVLMIIDPEPFRVQVEAAKARLEAAKAALRKAQESKAREVARAQLALNQASLELAEVEERRNRTLFARNAASREDVDRSEAATKKSAAQVQADKASLEQAEADFKTNILSAEAERDVAQADLRNAEIDLGYCTVASPINGRITRKLVDVGNLVGDGEATVLATIVNDDPVYAYLSVSESDLLRFREMVSKGERVDFRKEEVALDLGLANEKGFPHRGRLDYADPAVDPGTGTIQARGLFPNPDRDILAGLFARIRVPFKEVPDALLVPERALGADQLGRYLLIVGAGNKVEQRHVTVGPEEGDLRVISQGLSAGDRVVIDGVQQARPGQVVNPQPAAPGDLPAAAAPAPAPAPAGKSGKAPPAAGKAG